jgi:signal transduction histidine kinase/PAS domain-containing protein
MALRDRADSTWLLLVVSLLLFCVPLVDMWQDVAAGKPPASTVLENSIVLLLSGSFVRLSVWLLRTDWEPEYARLVARWSILGTGCVTLAYGWVLGFQVFAQNDLKPYVIAADGVVIAGLALFVAGVYNARSERESAARTAESERFAALFDNTSDAMVAVESGDGGPTITAVNEPFERAFGGGDASFVGQPAAGTVADRVVARSDGDDVAAVDDDLLTRLREVGRDPDTQTELRLATTDGPRDYLLQYVPVGVENARRGFFIFTDITPQKRRERQFKTLSEGTEGLLDARSVEGVTGAVRTLVVELFDEVVVGVWRYDRESDVFRPLAVAAADPAADHVDSLPDVPATQGGSAGASADGAVPPIDTAALDEALSDRGVTTHDTAERRLSGEHTLTVSRVGSSLSTTDRYLIDLLVADTRAAVRRVDREAELARRNDQLEFVNSLLRHDIQNSMTVIRARGQALSESCDGRNATYADTIVTQSDDVIDLIDRFRVLLGALTGTGGDTHPVDLSTVLEDRVGTARTTYPELAITADVPEGVEVVANDVLGNVIGNLVDNAVEHNDGDPTVEVSVTEREGSVVVRIADDGPGIPDDSKDTVFRRGNRGLKESDIGSGFGLFFVDAMMDQYGGEVSVADNDPGGSVFTLVFRRPA